MKTVSLLLPLVLAACGSTRPFRDATGAESSSEDPERARIAAALDGFHRAASEADERRYFDLLTEEGVFLGTDATERWTKEEFRAYAEPHFALGRGWTYRAIERHVHVGPDGRTAWFDEKLWNDKYGDCRGTGVLLLVGGEWKIAQYNLTFPVPNEIAGEVVERIKSHTGAAR